MSTPKRKMVIAGANGFVGTAAREHFASQGWEVACLVRTPRLTGDLPWDGRTLGPWSAALDGADALLNFAGRSVDCRYTPENKRQILQSRTESTRVLGQAIAQAKLPPATWLNASTATYYRDSRDRDMDEPTGEVGHGFSVDVAKAWEAELDAAKAPHTRKVKLRISFVLGAKPKTAFAVFYRLVTLHLGGTLGPGDQYVSWIHLEDFLRALDFLLSRPDLEGPFILASPDPQPMRTFMRDFRRAAGVSWGLPAAGWQLEIGAFFLRTETELLLKSRRVVPANLLNAGFRFSHPKLAEALQDLVRAYRAAS